MRNAPAGSYGHSATSNGVTDVYLIIGLVLLAIWLIGFGLFRAIVGGVIHVFLILALFLLAWHFISHSRHATGGNTNSAFDAGAPASRQ